MHERKAGATRPAGRGRLVLQEEAEAKVAPPDGSAGGIYVGPTFEDEVHEYFQRTVIDAYSSSGRRGSPLRDYLERGNFILSAQYGCQTCGVSFGKIAAYLKVSASAVSQLTKRLRRYSKFPGDMPTTEALVVDIGNHPAVPVQVADAHFRIRLGPHASTKDVLRFAKDFLYEAECAPRRFIVQGSGLRAVSVPLVGRADDSEVAKFAVQAAADQTYRYGAANVQLIAGLLTLRGFPALSLKDLVGTLRMHPKFVWVDERRGWCRLFTERPSRLEECLGKMLAVAREPLHVNELLESMATQWARGASSESRNDLAFSLHYLTVLKLLRSLEWIRIYKGNKIIPVKPIVPSAVLSKLELALLRVMERKGGVARYWELRQATQRLGLRSGTGILFTPILRTIDRGVYALRGRPVDWESLSNAVLGSGITLASLRDQGDGCNASNCAESLQEPKERSVLP